MGKRTQHILKTLDCSGVIVTNHYFFKCILFLPSLPISFAREKWSSVNLLTLNHFHSHGNMWSAVLCDWHYELSVYVCEYVCQSIGTSITTTVFCSLPIVTIYLVIWPSTVSLSGNWEHSELMFSTTFKVLSHWGCLNTMYTAQLSSCLLLLCVGLPLCTTCISGSVCWTLYSSIT